jgi:ABC-2 type transport system permease protein
VTSLRVFGIGGLMSYRALFYWLTPWVYVPSLLVAPIFQILLFVYIGRNARLESDEFYVIGNALQYAAIPCVFAMGFAISGERFQQTLGPILVSPAPRLPLFLGRAVPVMLNGAFVAAFSLAVGGLLLGIDVPASALGPLALVVLVSAVSCTGLGLINGALGLRVREVAVLGNVIFGLLLIFTGANVPLEELPGWMQAISERVPLTHGIEAARLLADGAALSAVDHLIAQELLVGLGYGVAGYALIRFFEWQSRVHATLEVA